MKYYHGSERKKNYFEGWFFKHSNEKFNIAFIPSISFVDKIKKCYIQVITPEFSSTFEFPIESFQAKRRQLYIKIADNIFTNQGIKLKLQNDLYKIEVNLRYGEFMSLKPNIMGFFYYLPLECKHGIISMKHIVNGQITINDSNYYFNNDLGYIEKDYGTSFPQKYTWLQCNDFNKDASFFFSCATIPFLGLSFNGVISSFIYDSHEYRFATYNFARIRKNDSSQIELVKGKRKLLINYINEKTNQLQAPIKGNMERLIHETNNGKIKIEFYNKDQLIITLAGKNAGVEIG